MKIVLASYYGFCMGVKRAIEICETAAKSGHKTYLYHDLVHNPKVMESLNNKGIVIINRLEDVREEGKVIFPSHGVPPAVYKEAENRNLDIIDATCPLVKRVQKLIGRLTAKGYSIIHFGDRDHDETIGITGYACKSFNVVNKLQEIKCLDICR